jgi:hypothetical protein
MKKHFKNPFLSGDFKNRREFCLDLLLALQILIIFFITPLMAIIGEHNRWVVDIFLALMAFVSVFIVEDSIMRRLAFFVLGLCLIGIAIGPLLGDQKTGNLIVTASALLFSINVCWIVVRKVFTNGPVTVHRIRGAVMIYLSAALLFALIDSLLASFVPHAYSNLPTDPDGCIQTLIYFSLSTITTIGYVDVLPIHPFARSLAMLEAVFGQFYMGLLIATLIGQYVYSKQNKADDPRHSA